MSDLLETAVAAHGCPERWRQITTIDVKLSITGVIWYVKGRPDVLQDITMHVDTGTERVVTEYTGHDKRTVFEPHRVVVGRKDGTVVATFDEPERSFDGQTADSPWDDVHVAYFSGEALWTYLNTPFLYTRPDFSTREINPIMVDGETWRRLHVTFPPTA